ncbi:MAG: hypothetical protein JXB08_04425 [Bacilli bacterium]|nr:hypothetical protein [Bacilli bacterium]MBN2876360.1 hypothetical protein [Bacilli bacterium]
MEWYFYLLIAIGSFVLLFVLLYLLRHYRYIKIVESVKRILFEKFKDADVIEHNPNHSYQLEFQAEKTYLIKLIDMNSNHELIITNADNVVVNQNIQDWKRSTKPHFIPGMKEFIRYQSDYNESIKIVLIYPDCYNITKYINESDCYLVKKFQKVDGIYFIQFNSLGEFLEKH